MVIMPSVPTLRTLAVKLSAMYTLPAASSATPSGRPSSALTPGPPSPKDAPDSSYAPKAPVPAIVVIVPFAATLRTRLLMVSAM